MVLERGLEAEQAGIALRHVVDLKSRLRVGLPGGTGEDEVLDIVGEGTHFL
jgi:hypothetical protein